MSKSRTTFARMLKVIAPAVICGAGVELALWRLGIPEPVFNKVGLATTMTVMCLSWLLTRPKCDS